MECEQETAVPVPVVISREGNWFVAACPTLDIATQGKTEKEVKENIGDLIEEFFQDPDTKKPEVSAMMTSSVSVINMPIKVGVQSGKASAVKPR